MPHSKPGVDASRRTGRRAWGRQVLAAAAAGLVCASRASYGRVTAASAARVLVWSENTAPRAIYPDDIDGAVAEDLRGREGLTVSRARIDDPEAGLADAVLDATDVLIWWGRLRHEDVPDARAAAVVERVRAGRLGLVALHASFGSKPFQSLMGTACEPGSWRMDGRPEHVRIQSPDHPIARGVSPFTIPQASMFTEPFAVPEPEAVVLVSRWETGESFRSGLAWTVGQGRVFYFRPGHDAFPILFHPDVRQVIANAAAWAAPSRRG